MHKIISAMEKKKSLKELTVREVITMPEFVKYMKEVIDGEKFNLKQAQLQAITKGMRLQRTPLDSLIESGNVEAEKMVDLYGAVLDKSLIGFSSAERGYIYLVGMQAFQRFMVRLQEEEKKT